MRYAIRIREAGAFAPPEVDVVPVEGDKAGAPVARGALIFDAPEGAFLNPGSLFMGAVRFEGMVLDNA